MAIGKRVFRSEQSYVFERVARDAVVPLLRSRGITVLDDNRRTVGRGQSQLIDAQLLDGSRARIRVRLCWRRDGRNASEDLYSAAQLAASTKGRGGAAAVEDLAHRDRSAGITHTLFFQRDAVRNVHAALVPTDALPRIWNGQYRASAELIARNQLGRTRKNHADNGDSPTIWLQDDRTPNAHHVADVLWNSPDVIDLMSLPVEGLSSSRAKYWRALDALRALNRPSSVAEVREWLERNAPPGDYSDTRENLTLLTVNDVNRRHYDRARTFFRSDQGHPRDAVVRSNEGRDVRYQVYDLSSHGVFDIVASAEGAYEVVQLAVGENAKAYADAERSWEIESIEALDDARLKTMRAVVVRRGQREFRDALLRAYGCRCAISGCDVLDVLEAAHIVPYLGDHTQRPDNGLLLRSDLHTLFDLGRLWIDSSMKVRVAPELEGSEYAAFEGRALALPSSRGDAPHSDHLANHRLSWER